MSVPEFQSKRVKKRLKTDLNEDRYGYLSLDQAEPDLGDPLVGPSSIGAKPFPDTGQAYILASFSNTGIDTNRFWVPPSSLTGLGLGLVPGAVTIRDEGVLVGAANSFTVLNFVGAGVTIDLVGVAATEQTGIATIRINSAAEGSQGQFQYKGSDGFLEAVPELFYYSENNNVGLGTTLATERLHVSGVGTAGKIRANAFIGNPEAISGSTTLRPGDDENTFSKIGKLRSGYINVNTISAPDTTGVNTSLISTLISNRFTSNFINVSGVTTSATLESTTFRTVNENVSGISTVFRQVGTFSSIGVATITTLRSTDQVFSGITTVFQSDISIAIIGYTTATNAYIGVATIKNANIINGNAGVLTVSTASITNGIIGFSSVGITTIGFSTISTAYIGVATIANLDATNVNIQGGGSISLGSTLTVAGVAATNIIVSNRIGIKTTPAYELDVNGDIRVNRLIYTSNGRGNTGEVLTSQGANPAIWAPASNVTVGAANSVSFTNAGNDQLYNIPFTAAVDDIGLSFIDNGNLTYNPSSNMMGIGNTIPSFNLDVIGDINFTGTLNQNGSIYVASNWGKDLSDNIYKLGGNVGVGTSILSSTFTVSGTTEFKGNVAIGSEFAIGIGSTTPRSDLDVNGDSRLSGYAHFEGSITEKVSSGFGSEFIPDTGTLTIDASKGTIAVGFLTTTVSTWDFTGINTENSKSTTVTLIVDSSSLITYGEQCSVNGSPISGGVRWPGGIAPTPTDNEDILSFAIIKDNTGEMRVYGSGSLNFS